MIQRVQTLFLAVVIVGMSWFCFSDIWVKVNEKTAAKIIFTPTKLTYIQAFLEDNSLSNLSVTESNNVYILIVSAISAILSLISLFSFKKRVTQMKIGVLNSMLIVIIFAVTFYQISEANKLLKHPELGEYKIGFFLPIFALISNILANYYIKRDEDLVRSADRIR
jgi:hypothetical protein